MKQCLDQYVYIFFLKKKRLACYYFEIITSLSLTNNFIESTATILLHKTVNHKPITLTFDCEIHMAQYFPTCTRSLFKIIGNLQYCTTKQFNLLHGTVCQYSLQGFDLLTYDAVSFTDVSPLCTYLQ